MYVKSIFAISEEMFVVVDMKLFSKFEIVLKEFDRYSSMTFKHNLMNNRPPANLRIK